MPSLNIDKCYTQQPKRLTITVQKNLRHDWLTDFYELLSLKLELNDETKPEVSNHQTKELDSLTEKELFFKELNRHLGPESTYSLKEKLLDSFSTLYVLFNDPTTSDDKKSLIASRIEDSVKECTEGFNNQVDFLIIFFSIPQNQDELIAQVRFKLVDRIAGMIAAQNPQGTHVHNRVISVSNQAGFGVWPINTGDVYLRAGSEDLSDADIISRLQTGFANHFNLFSLVNALRDELKALIVPHGYQDKRGLENDYKLEEYQKFNECINLFIPIEIEHLLEKDEKSEKITDINWQNVNRALLKKLRDEGYVSLSQEEAPLLDKLLLDESSSLDLTSVSKLIPDAYELAQFLEFCNQWSMAQKEALVLDYLSNKLPDEQKEVLAILHNETPRLTAQLKKEPGLQAIYFPIAINEKDAAAVRTYIEAGADINQALLLLFSQEHKRDTLFWLHDNPHLLQKLTVAAMNTVIPQGKYQGKTIAETLVSTKKGRQLVLENDSLQTLLNKTTMANILRDALQQADTERRTLSSQEGFFKKASPLATQLVQCIVYGDLTKAEALLKANKPSIGRLVTEKVTVIDYSRRKVKQKTAFQAALCAMDDELCAMLAHYMQEDEMLRQYQENFPKGHETYYKKQTPFDFSQIVEAISQSSDEDVQKALGLELPNNTVLWSNLLQFRADFTQRSSQEAVFNPQHLIKVFQLHDIQFDRWSWNQRDLFWRQVVGYVQRFLPANIAMDFVQRLHARAEEKQTPSRSLQFKTYNDDRPFFPLVFESFSGLGYQYAVNSFAWCMWREKPCCEQFGPGGCRL